MSALLLALLLAQPASDSTDDLSALLNESVVTGASNGAESASTAPAWVTTVTAEDMRTHGLRTLAEVMNFMGVGMLAIEPWSGDTTTEGGARGLLQGGDRGNHFLVLLDGRPLNNFAHGGAQLDRGFPIQAEEIDSIELLLGPGSVLYGSSAMFGVINVHSRHAQKGLALQATVSGGTALPQTITNSLTTKGAFGAESRANASVGYAGHVRNVPMSFDLHVGLSYLATPSLGYAMQGDWGGTAQSTQLVPNYYARFSVGDFTLSLFGSQMNIRTPAKEEMIFNAPNASDRVLFTGLTLSFERQLTTRVKLALRLQGDLYSPRQHVPVSDETLDCPPALLGKGCQYSDEFVGAGFGAAGNVATDWFVDGKLVTLVGGDFRLSAGAGNTQYNPEGTPFSDVTVGDVASYLASRSAGSAYVQQIYRPLPQLDLNAGLRLDVDQYFGYRFSPRVAIAWTPRSGSTLKLMYAEGFRAPSIFELRDYSPIDGLRSTNLAAETVRQVELVFNQRLARASFAVGAFAQFWDSLIDRRLATAEQIQAGVASGALYPTAALGEVTIQAPEEPIYSVGGNAQATYTPVDGLQLAAALSYSHARTFAGANASDYFPALTGNARISWAIAQSQHTLALASYFHNDPAANLVLRPTLSGPIFWKLRYQVSFQYAVAPTSAFSTYASPAAGPPSPSPNVRLQGFATLHFEL